MNPLASRPCPICSSQAARKVVYVQKFEEGDLSLGYDVCVCERCGMGFADGIPSQAELDAYYAERSKYTYESSAGAESIYDFRRFERIADQIAEFAPKKTTRILDIGCATGGLLSVLARRGYMNLLGSDPAPTCALAARRLYGLEVRTATLADHAMWSEAFDVVILVGVLEHLRDVKESIAIVSRLLAPGGLIYCAQPDAEAFSDCTNAPFQQFSTEHVNFISRHSLEQLFRQCAFRTVKTWRWMVEWRANITDSVVSGVFERSVISTVIVYDSVTGAALDRYCAQSRDEEALVANLVEQLAVSQEPVYVWGIGTHTQRLLAFTLLAKANIIAYVNSDNLSGKNTFAGRPLLGPLELKGRPEKIVISSRTFQAEILDKIKVELRLPNEVLTLYAL